MGLFHSCQKIGDVFVFEHSHLLLDYKQIIVKIDNVGMSNCTLYSVYEINKGDDWLYIYSDEINVSIKSMYPDRETKENKRK